jgi:hypothetical protein
MSETEALRATIMQEVDTYGSKRRFGLFSSPVSTAIGDDGQYKTRLRIANDIKILRINKENLSHSLETSIQTLHVQANSINRIFLASTHLHQEKLKMNTLILRIGFCSLKMKHSERDLQNSKCLSLLLDSKSFIQLLMNSNKKITQKKIQKETEI